MARIISISDRILDHYAALEVREANRGITFQFGSCIYFFLPDDIKIDLSWLIKYLRSSYDFQFLWKTFVKMNLSHKLKRKNC